MAQWERTCLPSRKPGFIPWVGKIPWRRAWQPTPVFLPGESYGQGSLVGYRPWSQRVRHDWATKHTHISWSIKNTNLSFPGHASQQVCSLIVPDKGKYNGGYVFHWCLDSSYQAPLVWSERANREQEHKLQNHEDPGQATGQSAKSQNSQTEELRLGTQKPMGYVM